MGKDSGSAPDPIDATALGKQQFALNQQTADLMAKYNRVNQNTPTGNTSWSQDSNGNWTQNVSMNPALQHAFDAQTQLQTNQNLNANDALNRAAASAGKGYDLSGLPALSNDYSKDRDQTTQSILDRLKPQQDQDRQALEARLASQGLSGGSQAWNTGMDSFNRGINDARLAAVQAGNQEQQQLFGEGLQGRQQGMAEQTAQLDRPFKEFAALSGAAPVSGNPQFPSFVPVSVANTDITSPAIAAQNQAMQGYQSNQQGNSAKMGGTGSLVGTGIMAAATIM